jgi:hypothetical protein
MRYVLRCAGRLRGSARHCDTASLLDAWNQTSGMRSCAITFIMLEDYARALNYLELDRGSDWVKAFSIEGLMREGKLEEAMKIGAPGIQHWPGVNMFLARTQSKPLPETRALASAIRPQQTPQRINCSLLNSPTAATLLPHWKCCDGHPSKLLFLPCDGL